MKTALFLATLLAATLAPAAPPNLSRCNIVWDTQSKDSVDSMPLAGGVLGLNVWVENNDLLFLIGSPNCLDENGMQTKLGLVRLRLSPALFDKNFRQELDLAKSEILVTGKAPGGQSASIRLWCDVNRPVIHAEMASGVPLRLQVSYETWANFEARFCGRRPAVDAPPRRSQPAAPA